MDFFFGGGGEGGVPILKHSKGIVLTPRVD